MQSHGNNDGINAPTSVRKVLAKNLGIQALACGRSWSEWVAKY
jgi:hypothetical protein